MVDEQDSKLSFLGFIPRCPFYKPIPILIILVLIALGTWGSYYLHLWAAISYLVYSLLFYFVLMPFTMCKHCYFKVIESSTDEKTGKTTKKLMDVDVWGKTLLHKHAGQGYWSWAMFIIWISPVVLIIISFFRNYNYLAIIALVGFILAVVGNFFYMLKVKCPECPIREYCHSAF